VCVCVCVCVRACVSVFVCVSMFICVCAFSHSTHPCSIAFLCVIHLQYELRPTSYNDGGLARLATLRRRIAAAYSNSICTLGGDFISPVRGTFVSDRLLGIHARVERDRVCAWEFLVHLKMVNGTSMRTSRCV
jgi:hypothetical protein